MKIDELPVEMLMKVFSYLARYENVSLVNKHFYDVAGKVNDSNICLTLRLSEFEQDLQLLQSIQNTNRKITNLLIWFDKSTNRQLRSAISVIKKFSTNIKNFTFSASSSLRLRMSDFLEILSLVPNAEHVKFNFLELENDNEPPKKKRRIVPSSEDLSLHQLKTLELFRCEQAFSVVFNRLPARVLTELCIVNDDLRNLYVLFKRQSNIKKLSINFCNDVIQRPLFYTKIFDNLKLESLELSNHGHHNIDIATILSKQTNLESVELFDLTDDSVMNVITNHLTELVTLSIDVTEVTVATFVNIKKMKKLKDLTLQNYYENMEVLESFANLNNAGITTLDLDLTDCDVSVDLIHALARSVPNLKVLRFCCDQDLMIINALLRNFNFVEVLEFDNKSDNENDNIKNLIQGDCFNPKLIELSIICALPYETSIFEKFIVDYPNLQSLYMLPSTPLSPSQLDLISNFFRKIRYLELN